MELEPSRYDVVYPGTCVVCGPFRGVCLGWCGVCWQQWVRLQPPSLLCWYPQELRFFYAVRELQGATRELREVRGLDSCFLFDPPPGVHPWPIANSMRMSLNLAVVQVHMSLDSAQQTRKCHSCVVTFNLGHPVSFSLSPDGDPMVLPWRSDPSPSPTPKAPSPNRQPAQKQIPLQPPQIPGTPPDALAHWLPPGGGPSPSGMRGRDRR